MIKLRKTFQKVVTGLYCLSQLATLTPVVLAEDPAGASANNPATGKIVVKETGADGTPLGEATFILKNNDGGAEVSQKTSVQTGETTFENINPGIYTLTEKQAPIGYKPSEKKWTVEVENNGKTRVVGDQVGEREEELTGDYPPTGTYPDNGTTYPIVTVETSKKGEQYKAVNPQPFEREIPEGTLSKRIHNVNNLDNNEYGIELTVSGKTTYERKDKSIPLDVVILLDNSNSMSNIRHEHAHRAERAGLAARALVDKIASDPENKVALVTYGSTIFDGSTATVEKGKADKNGKLLNDSSSWPYNKTIFTAPTHNYSYLQLTNDPNAIAELKNRIPLEAEELERNILMYQFGATFTQKALMTADDILTQQARPNSKRVIFHITDGVPTMSYPINFNHKIITPYSKQLSNFKWKSPNKDGILSSDFIFSTPTEEYKIVRGDGESYRMFTDSRVKDEKGFHTAYPIKSDDVLSEMRAAKYAITWDPTYGNYVYLYYRESILAYPVKSNSEKITNHGDPTTWYFNGNIKPKGYDIFTVGIGVNGDPGATPEEATNFMKSISSTPDNYTNVMDTNQILDQLSRYFYTIVDVKKSIVDGTITDPMGKMIDFQLGIDGHFSHDDYTLTASDGSSLANGVATGGFDGNGGLLKQAQVTYDNATKKISVTGLYLGTGEKVTLKYNVRLNDKFTSNKFYDTNGRTILYPKKVEPKTERDFPIPKIRDVRKYPEVVIQKERQFGEIEFIKVSKKDKKPLKNAIFTLQKENTEYGFFAPLPHYRDIKTGDDGKLTFANLEDGKYQLFENASPTGYKTVQNKKILEFEVTGGKVSKITSAADKNSPFGYELKDEKHYITNEPIPPKREYPRTGGIGLLPFYMIGVMLMGGVVLLPRRFEKE